MDGQMATEREEQRDMAEHLRRTAMEERHKNERLAKQLSSEAMQQWRRSFDGMLALPTAAALGIASTTLYVAAFIERGFEVLQQSTEAVRSGLEKGQREFREMDKKSGVGQGRETNRKDAQA